jgi:N-carbamoylputrescine amidase
MSMLRVAATQMACSWDLPANLERAESLIRKAAGDGAQVILIQELFETPYFCIEQDAKHFALATRLEDNPAVKRFQTLAAELNVVLPCSWFERANRAFYNSLAIIDAGGEVLGVYRKSHIPNEPGYQEKTYFNPGDTGLRVWDTRYGKIGCGICWDQWFPEAARSMALMGAELLLYPTAIGSEPPPSAPLNSSGPWQRVMQGHAAANMIPVIASNRIGTECATQDDNYQLTFYGHSFIADHTGALVAAADDHSESVLIHEFDMDEVRVYRDSWGIYRDRRPDLYQVINTLDGNQKPA